MGSLEMVIPPVSISWDSAITLDLFRESATKTEKNPNSVGAVRIGKILSACCVAVMSQRFELIGRLIR